MVAVLQLFMNLRMRIMMDWRRGILFLHPHTVWQISPQSLAAYLVSAAVTVRIGRRFMRKQFRVRRDDRILRETIQFAKQLPNSEELVAAWEELLTQYAQRHSHAAA